nr:PREDICTED: uncharacterized protein LOC105679552 isoform X1 [Linepithema humile]
MVREGNEYYIQPRRTLNDDVIPDVSTRLMRDALSILRPIWRQTDVYVATFDTAKHGSKVLCSRNTGAKYLKHFLVDTLSEQFFMYDNRYPYWKASTDRSECVYSVYLTNDSRKTTKKNNISKYILPVYTTIDNNAHLTSTLLCVPSLNLFMYIPNKFCEIFMIVKRDNYDGDVLEYIVRGINDTVRYKLRLTTSNDDDIYHYTNGEKIIVTFTDIDDSNDILNPVINGVYRGDDDALYNPPMSE